MDNNFMELGEALTTVWELDNQNIDELQHEIAKQKLALDTVEDFITNKFGEE